jgi:hypothetical protein
MKYTKEENLTSFEFWAGAKQVADRLTYNELQQLDEYLEELFYDRDISETEINDIFWFEPEIIFEHLMIDENEFYDRPTR